MSRAFTLTPEQLKQFDTDGYLIIPDFISTSQCEILRQQANTLIDELDLKTHPRTIFKTSTNSSQTTTATQSNDMGMSSMAATCPQDSSQPDYFLDSADKISYFFEDGAFDDKGNLIVDIHCAINKIGHALHVLDPIYSEFSSQPAIKTIAQQLGYIQPIVLQSMIIFKQPRIGGVVSIHRDSTFLYTEPKSANGLWFALEDCTEQNGCLKFVPGSHKDGKCTRRFVRQNKSSSSTNMNVGVTTGFIGEETAHYDDSEFVSAPVKKGSLVLLHGDVVHMSTPNTSSVSRNIYTFHLIESHHAKYLDDNWLQWDRPMPHLLSQAEEAEALAAAQTKGTS